ncbi:MAG: carboxyl-terminal processing protease [Candidatus Eremiobacteraeota bacterium]|nr:carboxyl-terminal processing protease [Candidatus Eremiobacteraeota bacterium]
MGIPTRRPSLRKDRRLTARTRLLSAAFVVAVAALGGAAYAERAAASPDAQPIVIGGGRQIVGLDIGTLLGKGDPQRQMLALAYERVEHAYYKPVADQLMVVGEQKALTAFLKAKRVADPQVPKSTATGNRDRDLAILERTLTSVQTRYAGLAPRSMYTQVALTGMLGGLGDPYTTYLSPQEINGLDEQLRGGNFGGIGVYIVQDAKTGAILVDPIEGNPAIKAGVRPGDTIVAVDGKSTMGQKLDLVEREIRGPLGTVVTLTIKRHGAETPTAVRVTRAEIHVPSVRSKIESDIEYVRLSDFGTTSADEVRAAFLDGKKHNVHGYILDLRNNGGGLLDAAVDISSLFIAQGAIVSTIDRAGDRDVRSASGHSIGTKPLVILVNKYTASASEITAGAVQDYGVGTLVGEKTFGKGVVQSLYTLPDKGALKITTARYVTPKGRDIHHKGIVPDVVVTQRVDLPIIDTAADKQLSAAKKIIESKSNES